MTSKNIHIFVSSQTIILNHEMNSKNIHIFVIPFNSILSLTNIAKSNNIKYEIKYLIKKILAIDE